MATQADIYSGMVRHGEDGLPKRLRSKLGAGVSVGIGEIHGTVAGYGQRPAAANAATFKCKGVTTANVDNAAGADGDLTVDCVDGTYDFKNDGTHPCSQTDVDKKVYASNKETISNNSGDGPQVGILRAYNASNAEPGRPCRVELVTNLG